MIADKENTFKVLVIIAAVLGSLYILSPFIPVIMLAAVIAFALNPLADKIRTSRRFGHYTCIYVLTFSLFLLITVPFLTILTKFYEKIISLDLGGEGRKTLMESFNQHRGQLIETSNKVLSQFGLRKAVNVDALLSDGAHQLFAGTIQASTYVVTQIPDILFSFAVFLVTLFLFMRHARWMKRTFYSADLMGKKETELIVRVLKETSYSAVFSSIITGILQSFVVTVGATIFLDVDEILIFTITFLCSFIPVIGAAPIAFVLAIYAWTTVSPGAAIGLVVVGCIAGVADNVIRVFLLKVVKDELHPFWSLLSIIGGVIVLGLPGLFLGPVIVSATLQVVPALLGKPEPLIISKPTEASTPYNNL